METNEQKTKWLRVEMEETLHRQFRAAAALQGVTVKDAANEAVVLWLEKYAPGRAVKV